MSQSKKASGIEVIVSQAVGFGIAVLMTLFFWPDTPLIKAASVTVAFTIVSIARSYLLRRLFNHLHNQGILK